MEILLGSKSPRRRELLERMGLDFRVLTAEIDETKYETEDPVESVKRICRAKAEAVAQAFPLGERRSEGPDAGRPNSAPTAEATETNCPLILTADTIVVLDGKIMGKPHDKAEARAMLRSLSGREHAVYTAFCLMVPVGGRSTVHCEKTLVHFRPLTEEEIDAYVSTGEPMDKAGAYGIQGLGAMLVESITGDYFTVMGLPVCALAQALGSFGLNPLFHAKGKAK